MRKIFWFFVKFLYILFVIIKKVMIAVLVGVVMGIGKFHEGKDGILNQYNEWIKRK